MHRGRRDSPGRGGRRGRNGRILTVAQRPDRAVARCRVEAHAITRAIPRQLAQSRVAAAPGPAA